MPSVENAAALIIGNELLSGKIAEANLLVLARTLRAIGVVLERVVMVLDDREVIAAEVKALSSRYDVVFTSGGVGPTHDDVTVDAVADAFGVTAEVAPEIEAMLRKYYADDVTDGHLRMARVPKGAELVTTDAMPWHTIVMHNVWILPGVPQIFQMKMPVVHSLLGGGAAIVSRALFTLLDEGHLKPLLDRVVSEHPTVEVGSYPKWNEPRYRTKVTFDARDLAMVERARDALMALLPEGARVTIDDE
jgi:molybdenum cofactor synthesis domain-containing protein